MTILRIVPNIATSQVDTVSNFYETLFDLEPLMDFGWIKTLGVDATMSVQISIASQGGANTDVPDLSIEVDDVEKTYQQAQKMGCDIEYDLTDEPWGVRRFYLRDPAGKLLNILSHI